MAIPRFSQLFNITLDVMRQLDGTAYIKDIDNKVADILQLSQEDRLKIHQGTRTELSYRLAWTRNYLKRVGLIEKNGRGLWSLTPEGMTTREVNPEYVVQHVKESQVEEAVEEEGDESMLVEINNPDVELEDNSKNAEIADPFDPKKIDITSKQLILEAIFKRMKREAIDLFTGFQRQSDLWDKTKQSRLIESILIRFPLPAFYFDGSDDNKWQVVDGLQRLSTFRNFVVDKVKPLILEDLEFLKQFNGFTFDELPIDLQRRIEETEITVYIINQGTPDEVKFNIFKRINTGGLVLEPQEIRHALNQGRPATFVKELADLDEFKEATCYSIKTNRMQDRDFTTRFISFYLIPYSEYKPDLDAFMNKGMAAIKSLSIEKEKKTKFDFIKAMNAAYEIFGSDAFRKRYNLDDYRKPINKALFETWSVALANCKDEELDKLIAKRDELKLYFMELMNSDTKFNSALSSATGDKSQVNIRFSTIEELIQKILSK